MATNQRLRDAMPRKLRAEMDAAQRVGGDAAAEQVLTEAFRQYEGRVVTDPTTGLRRRMERVTIAGEECWRVVVVP